MLKSKKSPYFLAEIVQIWPLCCSQWDEDAKLQTGHKVGDRGRRSVVVPPLPAAARLALVGCSPRSPRRTSSWATYSASTNSTYIQRHVRRRGRRRRHGRLLQHRDGRERREGGAVEHHGRRHGAVRRRWTRRRRHSRKSRATTYYTSTKTVAH